MTARTKVWRRLSNQLILEKTKYSTDNFHFFISKKLTA